MDNSQFLETAYHELHSRFVKYLEIYLKVFVIYITIMGLVLKFSLDMNATPQLKLALFYFAIFICFIMYTSIVLAELLIHRIRRMKKSLVASWP